VPVPAAEPGKVVWLQPVLTTASGRTHWSAATAFRPGEQPPLERRPALLRVKLPTAAADRTLKLSSALQLKIQGPRLSFSTSDQQAVDVRETVVPENGGLKAHLAFGKCQARGTENGLPIRWHPSALVVLRQLSAGFSFDAAGTFRGMSLSAAKARDPAVEADLAELFGRACSAYQATSLPMPNRELKPLETWNARPRLLLGGKGKVRKKVLDLDLTCTYRGQRKSGGRDEAYISLAGRLQGKGPGPAPEGKVRGFALFDVEGGYVSRAEVRITSDEQADDARLSLTLDSSVTRVPGNTLKIGGPGPAPPGKGTAPAGKVVLNVTGRLTAADPKDRERPGYHKAYTVRLTAGTTYVIDMKTPDRKIDPYLRLEGPDGRKLAEDDDGGGFPNARIVFRAPRTGDYRVFCTTFVRAQEGAFTLTVQEQ
jgi:hypothetical protein